MINPDTCIEHGCFHWAQTRYVWYLPLVIPSSWIVIMQTNNPIQNSQWRWLSGFHRLWDWEWCIICLPKPRKGTEPECCSWVAFLKIHSILVSGCIFIYIESTSSRSVLPLLTFLSLGWGGVSNPSAETQKPKNAYLGEVKCVVHPSCCLLGVPKVILEYPKF
jgi:hypothetical protein